MLGACHVSESHQSSQRGGFGDPLQNRGAVPSAGARGRCSVPGPVLAPGGERASLRQRFPGAGGTQLSPGAADAQPGCLSGTTEPGFALCHSVFKQDRDFILTADVALPQTFFCIQFSVWVLFISGC